MYARGKSEQRLHTCLHIAGLDSVSAPTTCKARRLSREMTFFARAVSSAALRSCTVVAAGGLVTSGAARTDAEPARVVSTSPAGDCKKLQINVGINRTVFEAREKAHALLKDMPPIPELAYKPTARYAESTKEAVLHPLIEASEAILVPGAFFGDEGKGKTVDAIARHPKVKIVARVNSGENAGHTVIGPTGHQYAFHLCPSGLLTPGKINCIGPECVMDPVSFMEREVSQLVNTNVEYKDRLFVGNVHLVCPHHKLLDFMGAIKDPNKSTLQGMGPVHGSKAKRQGLRLDHLFNDRADAKRRLTRDLQDYWGTLKALGLTERELLAKARANPKVQKHVLDFIEASDKEEYVLALYDRYVVNNPAFPQRDDVSHLLRQAVKDGKKIVLEGPQSFWCARALASLAAARQSLIPSPLPVPSGSRTRARSSGTRERARTPARRACSRRAG